MASRKLEINRWYQMRQVRKRAEKDQNEDQPANSKSKREINPLSKNKTYFYGLTSLITFSGVEHEEHLVLFRNYENICTEKTGVKLEMLVLEIAAGDLDDKNLA